MQEQLDIRARSIKGFGDAVKTILPSGQWIHAQAWSSPIISASHRHPRSRTNGCLAYGTTWTTGQPIHNL